jgi:hypothetical protein
MHLVHEHDSMDVHTTGTINTLYIPLDLNYLDHIFSLSLPSSIHIHYTITMVHIRPEDFRLVVDLIRTWVPPHLRPQSLHQIKQDQAALLPLLTVSRVSLVHVMGS